MREVEAQTIRRDEDVAAASARVYAPALAALGEDGFAVAVIGWGRARGSSIEPRRRFRGFRFILVVRAGVEFRFFIIVFVVEGNVVGRIAGRTTSRSISELVDPFAASG